MDWSPGGWDLYAASFDVQSIREAAELLKGPQHLAAFVFYPASARSYRETQPGKQLIKRFRVPGVSTCVEYRNGAIGRDGNRVLDQRIHATGQSTGWRSRTTLGLEIFQRENERRWKGGDSTRRVLQLDSLAGTIRN